MRKIAAFIHGIYPRSEKLVAVTRDVDRKRKTEKELVGEQKREFQKLVGLQKSSSLDFIEDGKLAWQDIFRPIIEATEGLSAGPLTRWFDNNTFFRQPIITGKLTLKKKILDNFFPRIDSSLKWKATIPSPYMFAKLCQNSSSFSSEKIAEEITFIINSIIDYLEGKGTSFIQLNEPYLPYYRPTKKEMDLFVKQLSVLSHSKRKAKLGVYFYFGDGASIISKLKDKIPAKVIGVDFYKTNLADLPKPLPYELMAGIVDGRNSLIEKESILRRFVNKIIKQIKPLGLYLTNNSDLELLPETIASKKVGVLGRLKKTINN